jgi:hypothetical protein
MHVCPINEVDYVILALVARESNSLEMDTATTTAMLDQCQFEELIHPRLSDHYHPYEMRLMTYLLGSSIIHMC